MLVLVGCEESQIVTRAFRARGHVAYSCDLAPTRGRPEWHLQGDVVDAVHSAKWDLIILHPPCTAMAVSGNGTYAEGKPKHHKRAEAIKWTLDLWEQAKSVAKYVALENPKSVIFNYIAQVQYIKPEQFGHAQTKITGLALHRLPFLRATDNVLGWDDSLHRLPPSPDRARIRSTTFQGIANAMAEQWGELED